MESALTPSSSPVSFQVRCQSKVSKAPPVPAGVPALATSSHRAPPHQGSEQPPRTATPLNRSMLAGSTSATVAKGPTLLSTAWTCHQTQQVALRREKGTLGCLLYNTPTIGGLTGFLTLLSLMQMELTRLE